MDEMEIMMKKNGLKETMGKDRCIPRSVIQDDSLNPATKLIYGDIILFYDNISKTFSLKEIIQFSQEKKYTVKKALNDLTASQYICKIKITDQLMFEKLNVKNSDNGCLFCGYDSSPLDKHHFPIRAKEGGSETIEICANCHREFHCGVDYNEAYTLSKEKML